MHGCGKFDTKIEEWRLWTQKLSICGLPRGIVGFAATMLIPAACLICGYEAERWTSELNLAKYGFVDLPSEETPNNHHVWWARSLLWTNGHAGILNSFGLMLMQNGGNWTRVCQQDSNDDGITNGQHLGDPCCLWQPGPSFSLERHHEYRRWHISHPGEAAGKWHVSSESHEPSNCDQYDAAVYKQQFDIFYFNRANEGVKDVPISVPKLLCGLAILAIYWHWIRRQGLLQDAFPLLFARSQLSAGKSLAVCAFSYFYMDLTSGVIHLILDYAPKTIPGLGHLANGFQYHHEDPTAIIRISWFEYASHIHLLIPVICLAIFLSDATRMQRLFWAWGGVWAHLFQTAHRWAHMPADWLPFWARLLQSSGLILTHERHMLHHQDLEHQFTILSGQMDVLLDSASHVVPATRYDLWFLFGVFWFLTPICLDIWCRPVSSPASKQKVDVDYPIA